MFLRFCMCKYSKYSLVWTAENLCIFHEQFLHSLKVEELCGVSRQHVIDPLFFRDIVNAEYYHK